MWAYIIAKHYGISLKEVHEMTPDTFQQSLVWAMVGRKHDEKENKRRRQEANNAGRETVSLDYTFVEDF
tara:strand:+ start:3006 stop:3212 length:207 start_codon:yes stop_codon:yes gene_type:complete